MPDVKKKKKINDGIRASRQRKKQVNGSNHSLVFDGTHGEKKSQKKQGAVKKSFKKVLNKRRGHENKSTIFSRISSYKKMFKWFFFFMTYIYILFFVFNKLEKTVITVSPKTFYVEKSEDIIASLDPEYGHLGFDIIAIKESREGNLNATTHVTVHEKAHGIITIFNNYSSEPQRLSPETRFRSVSGKVFKLGSHGVIIPGKKDGKPGKVEAEVYASEAGSEYNIGITDFTIPGFKELGLNNKYQNIYALSLKPFEGGFIGDKLIPGEDEKQKVIQTLESELKEILIKRLAREKTDKVILVDNSIQILFKNPVVDGSHIKQDAQVFALLIEKKQLENYLRIRYLPNVHKGDVFLEDFGNINFSYSGAKIDFDTIKTVHLHMNMKGRFTWALDKNLIRESLAGLGKEDIAIILREFKEIQKAYIKIFPFWQKHISSNEEHILIEIME